MNHEQTKRNIAFASCPRGRDGRHQRLRWLELAEWNRHDADLQSWRRSGQRWTDREYQHDHGERDDLLHDGWNATRNFGHGNDREVRGARDHYDRDHHRGRRDGARVQQIDRRLGELHDFDRPDGGDAVVQSTGWGGRQWNDGRNCHDDAECDDLLHD